MRTTCRFSPVLPWYALAVLLAAAVLSPVCQPAWAGEDSPTRQFSARMTDLRTTLDQFAETITRYNQSVAVITAFDLPAARVQVEEIRRRIETLLSQLAPDSPLAHSQTALARWIDHNARLIRSDALLSEERKTYLLAEWTRRGEAIEAAGRELQIIRRDLHEQLKSVVGDQTYLTQLVLLEKADEAAAVVRTFLAEVREFAAVLRNRLRLVPTPGS